METLKYILEIILIIIGGLCVCHYTYLPIDYQWKNTFLILGIILIAQGVKIG